jgi:anti-sigma factor RsiW
MACAEFEPLLMEYAGLAGEERARVARHVAQCAGCREFLDALEAVDAALATQFARSEVYPAFAPEVRRRVRREASLRRPSWVPELLDGVGWIAIVTLIGLLSWWASPLLPAFSAEMLFTFNAALAAGAAFVIAAFLIGLHSFAELKH